MSRPNILILYTDQHRWDAVGVNGNRHIHTPNLDRLAVSGTTFDHFFVQNPLCMPSRASFLTGRYPSSLGITHMGVTVPVETPTIATYLKSVGYRTANIGKLHFQTHANRDHRRQHPNYGFDELEISDEPGVYEDGYRAWVRRRAPDQLDHLSVGLPPATAAWQEAMGVVDPVRHPSREPRSDFIGPVPFPGDEAVTHTAFVAERTIDFIQRQSWQQPFLCIAGFYSPHAPWVAPQRFLDLYDPTQLPLPLYSPEADRARQELGWTDRYLQEAKQGYYAMISEVDFYIGRILKALTMTGQAENTIVLFTSDHGEWLGDGVRFGKGYPGDDYATRVPLIVRLPAGENVLAGKTCSHLTEAVDVLPTLLDAVAIQPPPELQGHSFFNELVGRPFEPRQSVLVEFAGWKSLRTMSARYLVEADGQEWLWDAEEDIACYHNLALDPTYKDTLSTHRYDLLQRLIQNERPLPRSWPY